MLAAEPHVLACLGKHSYSHTFIELGVLVVGIAKLEFERLEKSHGLSNFAFQRIAIVLHVDAHIVFSHRPITAAVGVGRQAQVALVPENAAAQGIAMGMAVGVANGFGTAGCTHLAAGHGVRHSLILGLTAKRIRMHREFLVAAFQHGCATRFLVAAGPADIGFATQAGHGLGGYAVVNHIHHTAYRTAAIHDGRRSTQHLDALNCQGVQWHGVVIAQCGQVLRRQAVVQNLDAIAVHAANDGTAGIGAKVAAGDAGSGRQGFAQSAFQAHQQCFALQDLHGLCTVAVAQGVAGDRDLGQSIGLHRRLLCHGLCPDEATRQQNGVVDGFALKLGH